MSPRTAVRTLAVTSSVALVAAVVAVVSVPVAQASDPAPAEPAAAVTAASLSWRDLPTGTTARLRGLAPVNRRVAWVSGTGGTVLRTVDGGASWQDVSPGGDSATLEFRDIEAFDRDRAVVLSIGEGGDSRIYRTTDAGTTWQRTFTNSDPAAFYDCMGFWDDHNGLAMSDPVDGRFRLLRTSNAGRSWSVVDPAGMPAALPGEFGFAASGTCLVTVGHAGAYLATGGGATSRVFHSSDRGQTWTVSATTVASGDSAGIFSLAVRGTRQLVAVGGDYLAPTVGAAAAGYSTDAGRTWRGAGALGGYRSGAAWLTQHTDGWQSDAVVAVGPTGTDVSTDEGRTWRPVDTGSLDSVQCTADRTCWASGDAGRVAVLAWG